ncbi:MAG: acyl-protein synthetase [Coriobacteriia bacterium]|nr:acyl-protein synthetase [Coriobacteriia bacterium]
MGKDTQGTILPTYENLCAEVLEIIERGPEATLPNFNELALLQFRFQYAHNDTFRQFVDAKKVDPAHIDRWEDIPLIYGDAFKSNLISSFPLENSILGLITGGTTSLTQRGQIFRDEWGQKLVFAANRIMTKTYVFPDFDGEKRCRLLILAPSPEVAPSMGMAIGMEQTLKNFGSPDSEFLFRRSGIDVKKLVVYLRESERTGAPLALIGATSAFVYFFQACKRDGLSFKLPEGSRLCDGGGYRGRFGVVTRDDYYKMVTDILGVPAHYCVNTLGEGETATNLFDDSLYRYIKGLEPRERSRPVPPWSRVRAMSVDDLTPLPDGEVGLLAHWDLANAPTVLSLITDNLGYTSNDSTCCEIVGRAKLENNKISSLPDENAIEGSLGDTPIFRMLETYVNFTLDLKMRLAHLKGTQPSVREEVEARPTSVASCPQVIDEMLLASTDEEAARRVEESLAAFERQANDYSE